MFPVEPHAAAEAATKAKQEAAAAATSSTTQTTKETGNRARTRSNSSDFDGLVDRTSEFPSQPVGMAPKPSGKTKKKKKNSSKKQEVVPDEPVVDEAVYKGTEAGHNLFKMLISD